MWTMKCRSGTINPKLCGTEQIRSKYCYNIKQIKDEMDNSMFVNIVNEGKVLQLFFLDSTIKDIDNQTEICE